jgi:hypothetical protein
MKAVSLNRKKCGYDVYRQVLAFVNSLGITPDVNFKGGGGLGEIFEPRRNMPERQFSQALIFPHS